MYLFMQNVEDLIQELFQKIHIKEKSKAFYQTRIEKFFVEYMAKEENEKKPLNAITYFDINTHIQNLKNSNADKLNNYNALKRFFTFTYERGITGDIMSQVDKPERVIKSKQILSEDEYKRLTDFIACEENDIEERLVLGLFIYTGLSRQYIAALQNNHFIFERGLYYLFVWKDDEEVRLPLKAELQLLIKEYCMNLSTEKQFRRLIEIDENSISTYVGNLVQKAIGKKYTPTVLSNTFIKKALSNGNYIWEVSKLTLESVSTIEQHVCDGGNLLHRQTSILNGF